MTDIVDDILAHYGKKGMKWGIRTVHAGKVKKRTDRLDRVASGTANRRDRVRVAAATSGVQKVQAARRGQSVAAMKSQDYKDHVRRLETGEAKARDLILQYGFLSILDLNKARRLAKA